MTLGETALKIGIKAHIKTEIVGYISITEIKRCKLKKMKPYEKM